MPTYNFRDKTDGREWSELMTFAKREEFLAENQHIESMLSGSPMIVTGVPHKPDNAFRDVLRHVKSSHRGSNINTF